MARPDYYKILQVARGASADVISAAYRAIMSKQRKHPDLGGDEAEAKIIGEAYAVLSDPIQRRRYDELLEIRDSVKSGADQSKDYSGSERRRAARRDVEALVSFCVGAANDWSTALARDVSELGIRIQSKRSLLVNDHLVIVGKDGSAAMHGVVRWQRMAHASVFGRIYEAGVEFFDQISDVFDRVS